MQLYQEHPATVPASTWCILITYYMECGLRSMKGKNLLLVIIVSRKSLPKNPNQNKTKQIWGACSGWDSIFYVMIFPSKMGWIALTL